MAMVFTAASSMYLAAASEFAALRATASMCFWIKTTQVGNDTMWQAPGVSGIEQAGGGDDIFWGWIDNNAGASRIGIQKGDTAGAKSGQINTGAEFHVVLTWDSATGLVQVYVNGAFVASATSATGGVVNTFSGLAVIGDTGGTPVYFGGTLDDIRIYNRVLLANEISAIYAQRGGDDIYEGLVHKYMLREAAPGTAASGAGTVRDERGANHCTPTNSPVYAVSSVTRRRAA
jgi:MSHA biogenesis protein MshQ